MLVVGGLALLFTLLAVASASIQSTGSVEVVDTRVEANRAFSFFVFLKHTNLDQLHSEFLSVSDPRSTQYGKYLTQEQARNKYGASSESKTRVANYFSQIPGSRVEVKANNIVSLQHSSSLRETQA